jgi:hypothetical protein
VTIIKNEVLIIRHRDINPNKRVYVANQDIWVASQKKSLTFRKEDLWKDKPQLRELRLRLGRLGYNLVADLPFKRLHLGQHAFVLEKIPDLSWAVIDGQIAQTLRLADPTLDRTAIVPYTIIEIIASWFQKTSRRIGRKLARRKTP